MVNRLPESCKIAFKEWSGVCDALIEGRQTIILRKGGISERAGPGQFAPEHTEFWLYPTWTHQKGQGLRPVEMPAMHSRAAGPNADGSISIRGLVRVGFVGFLSDEDLLGELRPFHGLTDETLIKRFHYRSPGLWVLAARVFRRDPAFSVQPTPEQAGCVTWVNFDEPLSTAGLVAVLDENQWACECNRLRSILCPRAAVED